MNTEEKLTTIAENAPKVYKAGKQKMIALHPEKTVSGSYISVDDVSELPHDVKCKVTGVDNPESVTVTRCGANLFDCLNAPRVESNKANDNAIVVDRTENSITVQKTNNDAWEFAEFILPDGLEGETITICAEWTSSGTNGGFIRINWNNQPEGPNVLVQSQTSGVAGSGVITKKPDGASWLSFYLYGGKSGSTGDKIFYKNVMVNIGDKAIPFEPYNGQTLTPNADGTVDGMTSTYPQMNIVTYNADAMLNVTYRISAGKKAEYDAFWDDFQQNGNRSDYRYAFAYAGWNDNIFKPKYPIMPTQANQMLIYAQITGDLTKVVSLDLSQVKNFAYMFGYMSNVTRIGIIDTTGATTADLQGVFYNSPLLETIDKIILKSDGSQSFTNTFTICSSLKSIVIEGVIGTSINFQWCPLTKESITSIINALSATASGQTATFKKTAEEAAFTADEWAELIATKSNWTFSLV